MSSQVRRSGMFGAAAIASLAGIASAVPVLITSPATIGPTDVAIIPTAGGAPVPLTQAEITVRGTTLTINGRHTIQSLVVERAGSAPGVPGVLTHSTNAVHDYSGTGSDIVYGMTLNVSGNVLVQGASGADVASRIDLTGAGFPSGTGPGTDAPTSANGQSAGGGHGGFGGRGFLEPATNLGGPSYGLVLAPTTFGSGGGPNSPSGTSLGGAGHGGGSIKLDVAGTVTIDGLVSVNGTDGTASWYSSGGGAGGSVWIITPTLVGSGSMSANGGAGNGVYGAGGGGGGRIRIDAPNSGGWSGSITAYGGTGAMPGGAGTIATYSAGGPAVLVANSQATNAATGMVLSANVASVEVRDGANAMGSSVYSYGNVVVRSGSSLRVDGSMMASAIDVQAGANISSLGALIPASITCSMFNLAQNATFSVDALGHPSSEGPGAGGRSTGDGGGAGHAGFGGRGYIGRPDNNGPGGGTYGSFSEPASFGSGGGASSNTGQVLEGAGAGGGVIRLVANSATINGIISANGGNGATSWYDSGGGSGGSIWITTGTLAGAGVIRANGGDGAHQYSTDGAGGGSGGRIALVVTNSSSFTGALQAHGGLGTNSGAAGTVYTSTGGGMPLLLASTANPNAAATPFLDVMDVELTVGNGARAKFPVNASVAKLNVLSNGRIVTDSLVPIDISVLSDVNIEIGGAIDADGKGHASGAGPSAGVPTTGAGAGGGHGGGGGAGGRAPSFATLPFGSADSPFGFGSGGGCSSSTAQENGGGGSGGGAIRLDVAGNLNIQGLITANGTNGASSWWDSGGGAGGGVQLTAGSITGSGTVSARGGNGARTNFDGGGGGGGRIGIFSCNTTLPLGNVLVDGGLGGNGGSNSGAPGEDGSTFFGASTVDMSDHPDPVDITVGQPWTMAVVATTSQPDGQLTYQWRRRNDSGEFIPISDGFDNRFYNVNTPELYVSSGRCVQEAYYDCIITDACGSFPSRPAFARIVAPLPCPCPADFDGSGGIDGSDLAFFFEAFEQGDMSADLDESGGIDFGDVGSFFVSYEGGC